MAMIQHKRGARANLDLLQSAGQLKPGEVYLITDEERLAVGISANQYQAFLKEGEGGGGISFSLPAITEANFGNDFVINADFDPQSVPFSGSVVNVPDGAVAKVIVDGDASLSTVVTGGVFAGTHDISGAGQGEFGIVVRVTGIGEEDREIQFYRNVRIATLVPSITDVVIGGDNTINVADLALFPLSAVPVHIQTENTGSGIADITIRDAQSNQVSVQVPVTGNVVDTTMDLSGLEESSPAIYFQVDVSDWADNRAETETGNVPKITTAPTISGFRLQTGVVINAIFAPIIDNIGLEMNIDGIGLVGRQALIEFGSDAIGYTSSLVTVEDTGAVVFPLDLSALPDSYDDYQVRCEIVDPAGNEVAAHYWFVKDISQPVINSIVIGDAGVVNTGVVDLSSVPFQVEMEGMGDGDGRDIVITFDTTDVRSELVFGDSYSGTLDLSFYSGNAGEHAFAAYTHDFVGNRSVDYVGSFTVSEGPVVESLSIVQGVDGLEAVYTGIADYVVYDWRIDGVSIAIANYQFAESGNSPETTFRDYSTRGRNGVPRVIAPTYDSEDIDGVGAGSVVLDGYIHQSLIIGQLPELAGAQHLSLYSVWKVLETSQNWPCLVASETSATRASFDSLLIYPRFYNFPNVSVSLSDGTVGGVLRGTSSGSQNGEWTSAAILFDGTLPVGHRGGMLLNGAVEVVTDTLPATISANMADFHIGVTERTVLNGFRGNQGHLVIFDATHGPAQAALFESGQFQKLHANELSPGTWACVATPITGGVAGAPLTAEIVIP